MVNIEISPKQNQKNYGSSPTTVEIHPINMITSSNQTWQFGDKNKPGDLSTQKNVAVAGSSSLHIQYGNSIDLDQVDEVRFFVLKPPSRLIPSGNST